MLFLLLQSLYQGLQEMLNYEGDDFQEVFLQPFQISYTGRVPASEGNKREEKQTEMSSLNISTW
jgi:hypothetical protein